MDLYIEQAGLGHILEKVRAGKRLSLADGKTLYEHPNILALGYLANIVRERLNGKRVYFIYNQHINYSNICVNLCKFCAFGREREDPLAYEMTIDEIRRKVRERLDEPIDEIHVVGSVHPDLPFSWYLEMLKAIHEERPGVHVQAFTGVEIHHLAQLAGKSVAETLKELMAAGLGSMPGGGAEVFSPRVRALTCPKKISGEEWLQVARTAHKLGLKTNATMLYGHIETLDERLEHLDALRRLQDETQGFLAFIPLAYHPKNNELGQGRKATTGITDLKNIAVSRLMLDNFPHVKAYWIMLGQKMAQVALAFGAADLDGTVTEERITRMAGGEAGQVLGHQTLIRLIREAGLEPVQRDTLYSSLKVC